MLGIIQSHSYNTFAEASLQKKGYPGTDFPVVLIFPFPAGMALTLFLQCGDFSFD
jgi:hypothetical protein